MPNTAHENIFGCFNLQVASAFCIFAQTPHKSFCDREILAAFFPVTGIYTHFLVTFLEKYLDNLSRIRPTPLGLTYAHLTERELN